MTIAGPRKCALASMTAAAALMAPYAFAQDAGGDSQETEQETAAEAQQTDEGTQQAEDGAADGGDGTEVDIARFDPTAVYDGWSANALLDEDAYNQYGEDIGEVEDLIVGPDGQIQRAVIEGGGFLDIGDAHAAVPWDMATRTGTGALRVEVEGDEIDEYARFPNVDDMPPRPENFRVRELIGDFVTADGRGYGTVDDVIFNEDGMIEAVVVYPAYGYGYRTTPVAVPYDPDATGPYTAYYTTDYGTVELDELRPFNYGEFQ